MIKSYILSQKDVDGEEFKKGRGRSNQPSIQPSQSTKQPQVAPPKPIEKPKNDTPKNK